MVRFLSKIRLYVVFHAKMLWRQDWLQLSKFLEISQHFKSAITELRITPLFIIISFTPIINMLRFVRFITIDNIGIKTNVNIFIITFVTIIIIIIIVIIVSIFIAIILSISIVIISCKNVIISFVVAFIIFTIFVFIFATVATIITTVVTIIVIIFNIFQLFCVFFLLFLLLERWPYFWLT